MTGTNRRTTTPLGPTLPAWLGGYLRSRGAVFPTRAARARLAIELSRLNVKHGTGGPFGAAIFDARSGRLISAGVNLVVGGNCSIAHAEVVAIMAAQRIVGHYDLGAGIGGPVELVSSTEPCTMCQGAVLWAGISRLVYCARGDDACAIGFDEGPKAPDWIAQFKARGIGVTRDVCRKAAVAVLQSYLKRRGPIYNSSRI